MRDAKGQPRGPVRSVISATPPACHGSQLEPPAGFQQWCAVIRPLWLSIPCALTSPRPFALVSMNKRVAEVPCSDISPPAKHPHYIVRCGDMPGTWAGCPAVGWSEPVPQGSSCIACRLPEPYLNKRGWGHLRACLLYPACGQEPGSPAVSWRLCHFDHVTALHLCSCCLSCKLCFAAGGRNDGSPEHSFPLTAQEPVTWGRRNNTEKSCSL